MEDVVRRDWYRGSHLEGEAPFEEVLIVVDQG